MQLAGLIAIYAVISAFGLYKIKAAAGAHDMALWLGGLAYGAGFCLWLLILRMFPLSIAFPIAAGALVVATQAVGYLFLREAMSPGQLAGVALIVGGISLVFTRV